METLVSTETLEQIDTKSIHEYSIPPLILMEHAGVKGFHAFLEHSKKKYLPHHSLVFIAGGGNNGGDALVMAREAYLLGMEHISIILLGNHISVSCNQHRNICRNLGLHIHEFSLRNNEVDEETQRLLSHADFIIDGITGTGFRGKLHEDIIHLITSINSAQSRGVYVLSVDIPSGISDSGVSTGPHINCDICITFGLQKSLTYYPLGRSSWGDVLKINPSFPVSLLETAEKRALLATIDDMVLTKTNDSDYKNKRGHLALFAGSTTYTGAAKITSQSAFHSGIGLVSLYCDENISDIVKTETMSLIVHPVKRGCFISKEALISLYDAVAVGPGWGSGREEQMYELLRSNLPVVCDADGIFAFASLVSQKRILAGESGPLILTPHPGELVKMLELLGMPTLAQEVHVRGTSESFIDSLIKIARKLSCVLVYKSNVVWIVDGTINNSIPVVVDGQNSALGVAGSGDALTGIIASFLSRGYTPFESALNGVLLHQRSGVLARNSARWFDVDLLIHYIGTAYKEREEN